MVKVWTWAWVGSGTRPIRINAHCTGVAVLRGRWRQALALEHA